MDNKKFRIEYKILVISIIFILAILIEVVSIFIIGFSRFFLLGILVGSFVASLNLIITNFFTKLMLDKKKVYFNLLSYFLKLIIIFVPLMLLINLSRTAIFGFLFGFILLPVSSIITVTFFKNYIFDPKDYKKLRKVKSKMFICSPKFEVKIKDKNYKTFAKFVVYKK